MRADTMLETELRTLLRDLTVPPDDALADEMSSGAARRRRRSLLPVQAAAVVVVAAATAALGVTNHGNGSVGPTPSPIPAEGRVTAPSQPGRAPLRLRCVAPGGRVTESTVTTMPNRPGSADDGNWARVYLPKADGSICTEISR